MKRKKKIAFFVQIFLANLFLILSAMGSWSAKGFTRKNASNSNFMEFSHLQLLKAVRQDRPDR